MASSLNGVLDKNLQDKVLESNLLVVGAGGIGCEVLKNLVMTGFKNIEIVSGPNLNLTLKSGL
jgi:ubiquitin-like 1-activating enzyme E1 B